MHIFFKINLNEWLTKRDIKIKKVSARLYLTVKTDPQANVYSLLTLRSHKTTNEIIVRPRIVTIVIVCQLDHFSVPNGVTNFGQVFCKDNYTLVFHVWYHWNYLMTDYFGTRQIIFGMNAIGNHFLYQVRGPIMIMYYDTPILNVFL